jgi:hypothetical protein
MSCVQLQYSMFGLRSQKVFRLGPNTNTMGKVTLRISVYVRSDELPARDRIS